MTSRFTLLAGVAGLICAGCSSPAEEGEPGPAPTLPPPGFQTGAGGTTGQVGVAGTGGSVATAGTGGAAPVGNAGAGGSAIATAGAGGTPAAAGAGGAPSTIPTGTGLAITHDAEGWVAGATNAVGIQGSFYTFADTAETPPGDTTIELGDMTTPATVCVSGVASQVLGTPPAYGQYYGGGVALNLADPGGMVGTMPWSRGTVTGFSFNVTGTTVPPAGRLRFKVTTFEAAAVNNNGYCGNATSGPNTFQFGTLVNECWEGGLGAPALAAATPLVSLQWQVATDVAASTPFDFCIENLTALTTP